VAVAAHFLTLASFYLGLAWIDAVGFLKVRSSSLMTICRHVRPGLLCTMYSMKGRMWQNVDIAHGAELRTIQPVFLWNGLGIFFSAA